MDHDLPGREPPDTWTGARRVVRRLADPVRRFLAIETASGVLLLLAALVALVWVNVVDSASYERVWHTPLHIGIGTHSFSRSLHFWMNEGVMTLFFFVVGLEIRREVHDGELSDRRRAVLPLAAALGGMIVPAALYLALNRHLPNRVGWGVPMATDIAFAAGVLAMLGRRIAPSLRILLLALAIADDLGAIVIIAMFYASGIAPLGLLIAASGLAAAFALRNLGVRNPWLFVPPGIVLWVGLLVAGIHPTIAGVILGWLAPVREWYGLRGFVAAVREALAEIGARVSDAPRDPKVIAAPLADVQRAKDEAVAPVTRLETALHPWVAFGVMPMFALANAGVSVRGADVTRPGAPSLVAGIVLGFLVGKPLGVVGASYLAVKLGWASLPRDVTWRGLAVVGVVAGVGFTMAIFIADLAFSDAVPLATAKLAVLIGSGAAMLASLLSARLLLRPSPNGGHRGA